MAQPRIRLSQLFRDPLVRAAFERAERDGGVVFAIVPDEPVPTGGASVPVLALAEAGNVLWPTAPAVASTVPTERNRSKPDPRLKQCSVRELVDLYDGADRAEYALLGGHDPRNSDGDDSPFSRMIGTETNRLGWLRMHVVDELKQRKPEPGTAAERIAVLVDWDEDLAEAVAAMIDHKI